MNKPTVSILTISQLSRSECLKLLFDCIRNQSYTNIKEWIIVDGSKSFDEGMCNSILINELINSDNSIQFTIKYIPYQENSTLGQLKNRANYNANGDILIWMDDDDYHMSGRIEYSVNKLLNSNKSIGGNINVYLHDIDLNMTFKTNIENLGNNKVVANTLIYKKSFLEGHSYPENLDVLEEDSFINNSYHDFEILIPETTIFKFIHKYN